MKLSMTRDERLINNTYQLVLGLGFGLFGRLGRRRVVNKGGNNNKFKKA